MYGQNLGGRPDAPGEPIFTKFCMRVRVPDVFLSFEFQKDRVKNVGAVGGRNFASPIDKAHRLYNSLLLPLKPVVHRWRLGDHPNFGLTFWATFFIFFVLFAQRPGRTARRTATVEGSKTACFRPRKCLLGVLTIKSNI